MRTRNQWSRACHPIFQQDTRETQAQPGSLEWDCQLAGPEKHIRQLTKWSGEHQQQQQQQDRRLVVDMYILKRLSPAKIQIQICLKLQSSKAAESSEQHRKLAIDLGANLVLNCDRCHDAGVYHAKPRRQPVPIGPGAGHRLDTHTHTKTEGQTDRQSVGRFGWRAIAVWPSLTNQFRVAPAPGQLPNLRLSSETLETGAPAQPAACRTVPAQCLPCPALCRSLLAPNFIVSKACYML